MKLCDCITKIEELFTLPLAEDFDNVGLLCGNEERDVTGILVCHDALEEVVEEAVESHANLIICFHPIIFSGLKSLTGKNYVERAVMKAIENKIAIYALHTAFDNDYFGVNYGICQKLGLQDQQILMPKENHLKKLEVYVPSTHTNDVKNAMFVAGAGSIGYYDECSFQTSGSGSFRPVAGANPFLGTVGTRENVEEDLVSVIFEDYKQRTVLSAMKSAHPYEEVAYQLIALENENHYAGLGRFGDLPKEMSEIEFLDMVKRTFNLNVIRHSPLVHKPIRRVGVLGGSGASGIKAARGAGCDAYITGDVKYHDFFGHENKMLICDIGHFESERFVTQQIFDILSEKFTKFAILHSVKDTNPVNYFF